jgi:hypothetical protein
MGEGKSVENLEGTFDATVNKNRVALTTLMPGI